MSNPYTVTIGLEIHAELHTNSKMWCGCKNDPMAEKPNLNVCEICMAHPGTLPVANKEAIKKVIQVGLAVGADIADFTEFDRKNYFYPDIPKGYQISQYKLPIVSNGSINGWPLTRIHLEEDTAKSSHDQKGYTLVDYNRAGVPLMELVTEPVTFPSPEEAAQKSGAFARELQRILRYLGASEANMEKGEMRVEANISVSTDPNAFGTKCEVKNLNSFRSVEEAIKFEVARHIDLIERGERVVQETRGWDETKMETFSQRKKENAHDYRYFPDPDLPKLYLSELFDNEKLKKELPELPAQRRERYLDMGIKPEYVEILVDDLDFTNKFFEKITEKVDRNSRPNLPALAVNYLVNDVIGSTRAEGVSLSETKLNPDLFVKLIMMTDNGEISSRATKDILEVLRKEEVDPKEYAERHGLIQKNDPEILKAIVMEVITENPEQVAAYKSGKEAMFMYFVGQAMKKSKGAGNPGLFQQLLKEALDATH